jgi:hypothetical protein
VKISEIKEISKEGFREVFRQDMVDFLSKSKKSTEKAKAFGIYSSLAENDKVAILDRFFDDLLWSLDDLLDEKINDLAETEMNKNYTEKEQADMSDDQIDDKLNEIWEGIVKDTDFDNAELVILFAEDLARFVLDDNY